MVWWLAWESPRPRLAVSVDGAQAAGGAAHARDSELIAAPSADRASGRAIRGVVKAQEVDAWTLRFVGGEAVRVRIHGEGGSSLDCVAQDAAGNLLDADADTTGRCELAWMPSHSGSYRIMIRNAGTTPSAYQLVAR